MECLKLSSIADFILNLAKTISMNTQTMTEYSQPRLCLLQNLSGWFGFYCKSTHKCYIGTKILE